MSKTPDIALFACLLLAHAAIGLAANSANTLGWRAPPWACSPAPLRRNILCPTPADGDKQRCNAISCLPDAGCATEDCNAVEGNIAADGIVALDAWMQRGTTCVKHSWSLADCCRLCQFTEGCNAWSYCNNPAGCGVGCEAPKHNFQYDAQLNLWQLNPQDYPARLNPEHRCQANGAWPYQTCTLKVISGDVDVKNPVLLEGAASNGWVSGSVPRVVNPAPTPAEPSSTVDPAEQAILDGFYDEGGFESGGILLQEQPPKLEQGSMSDVLPVQQAEEQQTKLNKLKQEQLAAQAAKDELEAAQAASSAADAQSLQLDSSVEDLLSKAEAQLPSVSSDDAASPDQQPPAPANDNSTANASSAASAPAANTTSAAAAAAAQKDKVKEEAPTARVLVPAKIHVSEAQIKVLSATPSTTGSTSVSSKGSNSTEPSQNAAFGGRDAQNWRLMAVTLALALLWQAAML